LSRLPERKSEFDSDLDEEEEDDRRNEEDDEDEELDRQERQDEEDDEDVYSDDMTASSSKLLTRIERLMMLPRQGQHGNGLPTNRSSDPPCSATLGSCSSVPSGTAALRFYARSGGCSVRADTRLTSRVADTSTCSNRRKGDQSGRETRWLPSQLDGGCTIAA
jgi:hypothetical protein